MPIARVALPIPAPAFDYWVPDHVALERGSLVRVRLSGRARIGVVIELADSTGVAHDRLQPIDEVLALPALPSEVLALCEFVAAYYQEAPGLALALALPPVARGRGAAARVPMTGAALTAAGRSELPRRLVRASAARTFFAQLVSAGDAGVTAGAIAALPAAMRRALRAWHASGWVMPNSPSALAAPEGHPLNAAQRDAVAAIEGASGSFAPFALQGITGSGKSEVYFAAAAAAIGRGGQVLLLVPEINLTPQLLARISAALPGVHTVALHSALSAGQRRQNWLAAHAGAAQLVVGTRLAVFVPLPKLALVVVDEEHDPSFKQQEGVRYHARDLAVWRAHARGVPIVLGSATPSLETYAHADAGRYRRLLLAQRADPRSTAPRVRLVPARAADTREGLAAPLREALAACCTRGEQALVFVNRRGFAPSLKCAACAWEAGCPRCSARLTVHREPRGLHCHHCAHAEPMPRACPACGNVDLLPRGFGTQRLERALAQAVPGARIARIDRDTTRAKGSFAAVRERFAASDLDVLVGTQMLAKGHDFPRLTLVGVVGADNALYSADFRATERLFALLMQVAGRAGRAELPGEVIVQTDFPDHPVFRALVAHDFDAFARTLVAERKAARMPPFAHLALLTAEAHGRSDVDTFLTAAHAAGRSLADGLDVEVLSPVSALLARKAGFERGQMVVQSSGRAALARFLPAFRAALERIPGRRVRSVLDIDPLELG